jgi:hypothetical protein
VSSFLTHHLLSLKTKLLTAVATLTCVAGVSAAVSGSASAATPQCGAACISVFSSVLGTPTQPNFVEAVLDGGAASVGQPVGLKPASRFDPSLDIKPIAHTVSEFYAMGLVSAAANTRYGPLDAVQQAYAPYGNETGLCVGLARVAEKEPLTLQPCTSPTTVWIPYQALASPEGYFPIVNAATTDFGRPFAMYLPRNEVVCGNEIPMLARRLQFLGDDRTLPASQLWGAVFGVLA